MLVLIKQPTDFSFSISHTKIHCNAKNGTHGPTVNDFANLLSARVVIVCWCLDCDAASADHSGMQAHGKAPCLSGFSVVIVTRVVLFLGVQFVPVNFMRSVCVPSANKVLSARGGSSILVISWLAGWLSGTGHRMSTPVYKKEVMTIVHLSLTTSFNTLS